MHRLATAAPLALAVAGCTVPSIPLISRPEAPRTVALAEAGARFPPEAAGLRLVTTAPDTAPDVREGIVARYEATWGYATVTLFRRDAAVPDGPSNAVRDELTIATRDALAVAAARGAPDPRAVRVALIQGPGLPDLPCSLAERAGRPFGTMDYTCVTGLGGRIVKLRITARTNAEGMAEANATVSGFATSVMRSLAGGVGEAVPGTSVPGFGAPGALPDRALPPALLPRDGPPTFRT